DGPAWSHAHGDPPFQRRTVQGQLPSQEMLERGAGDRGDLLGAVGAKDGYAGGVGVVASGLGTDHRLVDATRARLEDTTKAVDHEVVADVVPTVAVAMEVVDRAQHRGYLGRGVAVGVLGVVDEGELDGSVCGCHLGVLAASGPRAARDDRRLAGTGLQAGAHE